MSEGDVSLIQDEDLLRRMWQQTEDFGKKKQIRAHMYKLREERLKNLYGNSELGGEEAAATAEASAEHQEKGPRPTPHSDSFADQCFQSLKTKEIRDSESPTRDIHYTVKDDSKADGEWTVVSKEHVSDDGNTKMQSTIAHTSGTKEIDGGTATFAAMKENKNLTSQYEDDTSKMFCSEKQTKSVAAEQSVSEGKDGSVSTSKTDSVSSTVVKNISHKIDDSATLVDMKNSKVSDSTENVNVQHSTKQVKAKNQGIRHESVTSNVSDEQITQMIKTGKLLSREVNHPDSNTTVIIEKTQLPDGTICTSTRKEIRETSENKNNSQSNQKLESQYTNVRQVKSSDSHIIQGSEKQISSSHTTIRDNDDLCDFTKQTTTNDDSMSVTSETSTDLSEKHALHMNEVVSQDSTIDLKSEIKTKNLTDTTLSKVKDTVKITEEEIIPTTITEVEANKGREEVVETFTKKKITELCDAKTDDGRQPAHCVPVKHPSIESDNNTTGEYITTYQTDYTNKKISQDFSPTHEAWARSLRSSPDNPLRGGSPVRSSNKSLKSSMSSLRSSISPEKQIDRSPSPKKKNSSPERWSPTTGRQVPKHSSSPNERYNKSPDKSILKTDREYTNFKYSTKTSKDQNHERNTNSPRKFSPSVSPNRNSPRTTSPEKSPSVSPTRRPTPAINMRYDKPSFEYKPRDLKSPTNYEFTSDDFIKRSSPTRYTIDTPSIKSSRDSSPTKSINEFEFSKSNDEKKKSTSNFDSSTLTRKSSLKISNQLIDSDYADIDSSNTHSIVKKDSADSAEKYVKKEKAPFVRSETYDERCRKILGMPDKKTLVEDAEKNLNEILNVLPATTHSTYERELPTGVKSAEYTDGSAVPRKSSLKKTNEQQHINLVDAEFITVNKDGSISSADKNDDYKNSSNFIESEKYTEEKDKMLKKTNDSIKPVRNVSPGKTSKCTSPEKPMRSVSPDKTSRSISPDKSTRSVSPDKTSRSISPDKSTRSISPDKTSRSISPDKSTRSVSPDKNSRSISPNKPTRSDSPDKYARNISPNKTTKSASPDKTIRTVSHDKTKQLPKNQSSVDDQKGRHKSPVKYASKSPRSSFETSPTRKSVSTVIEKNVNKTILKKNIENDVFTKTSRTSSPEKKSPIRNPPTGLSSKTVMKKDLTEQNSKSSNKINNTSLTVNSTTKTQQRDLSPDKKSPTRKQQSYNDNNTKEIRRSNISPQKKIIDQTKKISPDKLQNIKTKEEKLSENKQSNIYKTAITKTTTAVTVEKKSEPTRTILTTKKYDIFKSDKVSTEKKPTFSTGKKTVATNNVQNKMQHESNRTDEFETYESKDTENNKLRDNKIFKTTESRFIRTGSGTTFKANDVKNTMQPNNRSNIKSTKMSTDKYLSTRRDSDVFIDEEHAKSSQENSPERIWPTPVDMNTETGKPRYPDKVTEPDDHTVFSKNTIKSIISENESKITNKIIEISDDESEITTEYKVSGSDECLLSVPEKVTKFLNTDDSTHIKIKKPEKSPEIKRKSVSDKVEIELGADECLLSVSDKVSKFANVSDTKRVDKTSITKEFIKQEIDESLKNDECLLSVNDKVSKFLSTAEKITEPIKLSESSNKNKRPDLTMVDETLKSDECLLSVSDKVNKFINTAEKLVAPEKSPGLVSKASKMIDDVKVKFENITIDSKSNLQKETVASQARKVSDEKFVKRQSFSDKVQTKSPTEKKPIAGPVTIMRSSEAVKKAKAVFENNSKTDVDFRKSTKLTDIGVYKKSSTVESVPDVVPKNDLIATVVDTESETEQDSKTKKVTKNKKQSPTRYSNSNNNRQNIENNVETTSTVRKHEQSETVLNSKKIDSSDDILISRRGSGKFGVELRKTSTDQSSITSRKTSRPQDSITPIEDIQDLSLLEEMLEKVTGYEQRRRIRAQIRVLKKNLENTEKSEEYYSSSKKTSITTKVDGIKIENRKSSVTEENGSRSLSPLRKDSSPTSRSKNSSRSSSPSKSSRSSNNASPERKTSYVTSNNKETQNITQNKKEHISRIQKVTDFEHNERKISPDKYANYPVPRLSKVSEYTEAYLRRISASNNLKPEALPKVSSPKRDKGERLFGEYQTTVTSSNIDKNDYSSTKIEKIENTNNVGSCSPPRYKFYRTPSPEIIPKKNEYETVFNNFKSKTPTRDTVIKTNNKNNEKPEWATTNILKKSRENQSYSSTKKIEQKKSYKQTHHTNVEKDANPVISSYGVGPRDENGMPLFGIKALRKQSSPLKTHEIKGTVIHKEYTIENGGEPKGQVTMTAYSTNPSDLDKYVTNKQKGSVNSITTTTKFGGSSGNTISQIHKLQSTPKAIDQGMKMEQQRSVRRGSVKSLTEKFIEKSVESSKTEKSSYPKAGLILRSSLKDNASAGSASSRSSTPGIARTSSNTSMNSTEGISTTMEHHFQQKSNSGTSFLDNNTKVTGVNDILTRMKNADIVLDENEPNEDAEARALLNKFLGATVLMSGMEGYVRRPQESKTVTVTKTTKVYSNIDDIWDERILKKLLEESNDYEERRRLRARLRQVMAEQEACAQIVAEAAEAGAGGDCSVEETTTHNKAEQTRSQEKKFSSSTTTQKVSSTVSSKVTENVSKSVKPVSPFTKFKQLDKQNSTQSSPSTPKTPLSPGGGSPMFKFTDPQLQASATNIKERLLQWCRDKTQEYENVKVDNFSTSWSDGLAFCALIHHFLPNTFDYSKLVAQQRRHNFTLAFKVADEKAGIYPLLDVDDMVTMRKPDWKCVFTYVQSIYRRFKDED